MSFTTRVLSILSSFISQPNQVLQRDPRQRAVVHVLRMLLAADFANQLRVVVHSAGFPNLRKDPAPRVDLLGSRYAHYVSSLRGSFWRECLRALWSQQWDEPSDGDLPGRGELR